MLNFEEDTAKIFQRINTMPLEHFDGFSAQQMHIILYDPFAEESPIPIRSQIDVKLLDLCPIFQIAKYLMAVIDSSRGIKLTSTGNLPPKIVKEIYERKYLPDSMIEAGITKLSNETRGKKYREISFYADLYFEAFPVFKTQMSWMGIRNEFVLTSRFFNRFASWFGLVKVPEEKVWFDENIKVKRTKLLIHLLG